MNAACPAGPSRWVDFEMIPVEWRFTLHEQETNVSNPHLIHLESDYGFLLFGAVWTSPESKAGLTTTFTITRGDGSVEYLHLAAGQQQVDYGVKVGVDVHRSTKTDDDTGTVIVHILGLT